MARMTSGDLPDRPADTDLCLFLPAKQAEIQHPDYYCGFNTLQIVPAQGK